MAILRSLLVNMGLNSSQYKEELKRTQKQTKTSFSDMAASVGKYSVAAATALAASAVATTKMVRNQQNMAKLSSMTVQEYNAMSFAAEQYGLSAEKISDVSKDTIEKIGEYINAGSGGLQDFADAMGMNADETLAWAKSVETMSGSDIFQKMINEMDAAGLSFAQMSHAIEGMGSDVTALIPLYADNGAELDRLTGRYNEFNTALSPEQLANYRQSAENIDLMTASIQQMTALAIEPAIRALYEWSSFWTNLGDFQKINTLSAELMQVNKEIQETKKSMKGGGWFYDADDLAEDTANYKKLLLRSREIADELIELRDGPLPPIELEINPKIIPSTKSTHKTKFETETDNKNKDDDWMWQTDSVDMYELNLSKKRDMEAQSLADSLKLSTESLEEKYERENAILENGLADHEDYLNAKALLDEEYAAAQKEATDKAAKYQYQNAMDLLGFTNNMFSITTSMLEDAGKDQTAVYKALFLAQKATAIPSMIIATEEASTKALTMGPIMGPILAASTKALGYASIGIVAGQAVAGVAHGGIDEIPGYGKDQTWLLQGGERVVSKEQNQDLKNYMQQGQGGQTAVNVTIQVMGNIYGDQQTEKIMSDAAKRGYKMMYDDARSNGPVSNQIRR